MVLGLAGKAEMFVHRIDREALGHKLLAIILRASEFHLCLDLINPKLRLKFPVGGYV